jgi:hypothetical protein
MSKWKVNWVKAEGHENYRINGRDGKPAVTVWRVESKTRKKLNKLTRKYEMITYPEKWCTIMSLMVRFNLKPVDTKESALEIAENELFRMLDEIEHNIGFFV